MQTSDSDDISYDSAFDSAHESEEGVEGSEAEEIDVDQMYDEYFSNAEEVGNLFI